MARQLPQIFDGIVARAKERMVVARGAWKALSISFINQAVSSATNFILALVLVRLMDSEGFGTYGIGVAGVLLFSGIGNALLLTQMVVNFPEQSDSEKKAYLGRNFLLTSGLSLILLVVIVLARLVLPAASGMQNAWLFVLASGFAAAGYLGKDFFIRVSYSLRREKTALSINIAIALTVCVLLAFVVLEGYSLNASSAITIYAGGQWAGLIAGMILCSEDVHIKNSGSLMETFRESGMGGCWALGGVLVTWLQSQAYVYMTAIFVGPVGVGYANAARIFVSPLLMAMPAINQVTMPRFSALRVENVGNVVRAGKEVTVVILFCAAVYISAIAAFYPYAESMILQGKYRGLGFVIAAWCGVLLMQLVRNGASTVLQTFRKFRRLTISSAIIACIAVPTTALLSSQYGAVGAVWATALAELGLASVLWGWVRRHV